MEVCWVHKEWKDTGHQRIFGSCARLLSHRKKYFFSTLIWDKDVQRSDSLNSSLWPSFKANWLGFHSATVAAFAAQGDTKDFSCLWNSQRPKTLHYIRNYVFGTSNCVDFVFVLLLLFIYFILAGGGSLQPHKTGQINRKRINIWLFVFL